MPDVGLHVEAARREPRALHADDEGLRAVADAGGSRTGPGARPRPARCVRSSCAAFSRRDRDAVRRSRTLRQLRAAADQGARARSECREAAIRAILGDLCTKLPQLRQADCTHEPTQRMAVGGNARRNGCIALCRAGTGVEPRSYSPSPVGVTFVVAAFTRSTGGILTDPSLPVDDVEAEDRRDGTRTRAHASASSAASRTIAVVQPRTSGISPAR